jgi:hypothetical protein
MCSDTAFSFSFNSQWQATLYPLLLTALLYFGPVVMAALELVPETDTDALEYERIQGGGFVRAFFAKLRVGIASLVLDIFVWRKFVVVLYCPELYCHDSILP